MGKFKDMIKEYASTDGSEALMWQSVELVDDVMSSIEEAHKDEYRKIMERAHVLFYGKHFDKESAEAVVSEMMHTDKRGTEHVGEHFSMDKAKLIKGQYLPNENCYDVYVALNATWHDFDNLFSEWFSAPSEQHFIKTAIKFWFEDEDYKCAEKVWCYFNE